MAAIFFVRARILLATILCLSNGQVFAQYVIGNMSYTCPVGASWNDPRCIRQPIYRESSQQMPAQVLEPPVPRKWGSIAVDPAKQVAGFSKGMETYNQAQEAAIKDCKSRGGKSCKLEATYANQCVGMVVGENSIFRTAQAETESKALQYAMTICEYESGVKCQVYYAGCSFADRVN